ncbi:hypothetical protein HDV05_007900 [Chytridiales sp. JEL 0842]|nr:hypothetical protein HDV05_007900 [Chytridiales sp. JEL 0842]
MAGQTTMTITKVATTSKQSAKNAKRVKHHDDDDDEDLMVADAFVQKKKIKMDNSNLSKVDDDEDDVDAESDQDGEDDDDDDQEEDDEEDEDDDEDDDEEEEEDEFDVDLAPAMNFSGSQSQQTNKKKSGAALYKPPTNDEMQQLKDNTDLFQSNLFKLQIDELLKEVKLDYVNKTSALDKTLHKMKDIFDSMSDLPDLSVMEAVEKMKSSKITIPFPQPGPCEDAKYKFGFKKPTKVFIAGSYLLKTVTKTPQGINVDVAVQMPEALFTEKDNLNYRYFYKRAYYLAVLAAELQKKKKSLPVKLSFDTLNGDLRRPILILQGMGDDSDLDFSKLKATIRIIPTILSSTFPNQRLAPGRNSVRPTAEETANPAPTPRYNTAILMDTTLVANLNVLHHHASQCPAFKDACMLGKVWLTQRGLNGSTFNGFLWSMLMGYLLRDGANSAAVGGKKEGGAIRLGNGYSSYQLVKLTLEFLAKHDFTTDPIFMTPNAKPLDDPDFSLSAFTTAFDVVIVDPSGKVNMAAYVSKSTMDYVQFEARTSVELFGELGVDRFDSLFLKNLDDPLTYFDTTILVTSSPKFFPAYKPSTQLDFPSRSQFVHYFIPKLLAKGIKSRTTLIYAKPTTSLPPWNLSAPVPSYDSKFPPLLIGLILDKETSLKIVEMGPNPSEQEGGEVSKEITDFQRLWGPKSQLRRFQDGTLAYSVVWETDGTLDDRNLITGQMGAFLIQRHVGIQQAGVKVWNGGHVLGAGLLKEERGQSVGTLGTFQNALEGLQGLFRDLKGLELPLSVVGVTGLHEGLRRSSVFVPQPYTPETAARGNSGRKGPVLRDYMDVLLDFESSTKWPEDLQALQQMKLAFYIKLAELLLESVPGTSCSISKPLETDCIYSGYIDVTPPSGYTFRIRVRCNTEIPYLQKQLLNPSNTPSTVASLQKSLEKAQTLYHRLPTHSNKLRNLTSRHSFLPTTLRLLKRFVASHLLLGPTHIPSEALELVCVKVFVDPAPYASAPGSGWVGFLRALKLLAGWEWERESMVVEFEKGEVGAEMRASMKKLFEEGKRKRGVWMCLQTVDDLEGIWWTGQGPSAVVLRRLGVIAGASLRVLGKMMQAGSESEVMKLFVTPVDGYDALIRLDPTKLPLYRQNLAYDETVLPKIKRKFKNLVALQDDPLVKVLERFDPVECYLKDLQNAFSEIANFFVDKYGGDCIAVLFNKNVVVEQPWKVNLPFNYFPNESENAVEGTKKAKNVKPSVTPNKMAMLAEMERLGSGLVVGVDYPDAVSRFVMALLKPYLEEAFQVIERTIVTSYIRRGPHLHAYIATTESEGSMISITRIALIAAFVAAFRASSKVRFYTRLTIYFVFVAILCILKISLGFYLGHYNKGEETNYYVSKFIRVVAPWLLNIKVKVEGEEHLDVQRPAVFICNHQSELDLVSIALAFPKATVIMAKKDLERVPLMGQSLKLAKDVLIDRGNRQSAIETMAKVAKEIQEKKIGLFLFPEGTRSYQTTNELLPFKKGAFYLAIQGQIPLVPIVVSSYHDVYCLRRQLFEGGEIRVKVLPPVTTNGLTTADVDKLLNKTQDMMAKTLADISGPVPPYFKPLKIKTTEAKKEK